MEQKIIDVPYEEVRDEPKENVKKGRNIGVIVVALISAAALSVCAVQIYTLSQKLDAMQQRLNDVEDAADKAVSAAELWIESEARDMTETEWKSESGKVTLRKTDTDKMLEQAREYDRQRAQELLKEAKEIIKEK